MDRLSAARLVRDALQGSPVSAPTAEEARSAIDTWDDLPEGRRRDLKSAVGFLGRVARRPLGLIVLEPVAVQALLDATTPAACGLKDTTFRSYRSFLRYVMQRLGVLADRRRQGGQDLLTVWAALLASLPDRFQSMRLTALARFASARTIAPDDVDDAVLQTFVEHLRVADIRQTAWERVRRTAAAWNRAAETVPGWPPRRLTAPAPPSRQYSLPFDAFPASLQDDLARFEARLRPATAGTTTGNSGGLYTGDGPIVPLRPGAMRTVSVFRADGVRRLRGRLLQDLGGALRLLDGAQQGPDRLHQPADRPTRRAGGDGTRGAARAADGPGPVPRVRGRVHRDLESAAGRGLGGPHRQARRA
jgi:hypothetical protein